MLGIKRQTFQVSACGKHPAFNDYFSVNMKGPLVQALASWVENGMSLSGRPDQTRVPRSFQFWVRGIKKGELLLGVLRESSDRMGRIYPLMIMGSLGMENRDRQWQTIFDGFESVFRAFEGMTAKAWDRFRDFEERLSGLAGKVPVFETSGQESPLSRSMKAWFFREKDKEMLALPVAILKENFADPLKEREGRGFFNPKPEVPGAVFLGGLPQDPGITIFSRALRTNDFLTLFGDNR